MYCVLLVGSISLSGEVGMWGVGWRNYCLAMYVVRKL